MTNGEVDNTDDDTDDDGSAFPAVELGNVHVMHANISSSLLTMFGPLPPTTLRRVSLLHPDPWFKKRHYKRRCAAHCAQLTFRWVTVHARTYTCRHNSRAVYCTSALRRPPG